MTEALNALNAKWKTECRPRLDIGMGINSGEMIADNIGAARQRGWNTCHIRTDSDPIAQERAVLRELGILSS